MFTLFDVKKQYTLPNGLSFTGLDLSKRSGYEVLSVKPCVVEIIDDVLSSFKTLKRFTEENETTFYEEDPDKSFVEALKKYEDNKRNASINYDPIVKLAVSFAALSFTDEQAIQIADLYPEYEVNHAYKKDERFTYNGRLFKVNQDHTSAAQWVPGETGTESLYTCLEMAGDGYLVWTQPTGAHNAYNTGDIVHYPTSDDSLYKSLIDGNVWSPDAYPQGWEIYNEA